MANLGRLLGMLLATRMAGRGKFGSALGTAALLRGGLASKAGIVGLGYMAYQVYRDGQAKRAADEAAAGRPHGPASGGPSQRDAAESGGLAGTIGTIIDSLTGGQMAARKGQPGRGDEVESYFDPGRSEPGGGPAAARPPEAAPIDDGRALLLIRAMIAAANADGRISPEERRRIIAKLDEAGADAEDHRLIEQELLDPKPLESLLGQVEDHETAQQFYAASRAAMDGRTATQTSYLDYLRNRLNLPPEETREIDQAMQ